MALIQSCLSVSFGEGSLASCLLWFWHGLRGVYLGTAHPQAEKLTHTSHIRTVQVSIVRSTTITLTPSPETDVSLVYRGFIHPLLPGGPGGPGAEDVAVWARAQRLHVLARMARGPDTENMVRDSRTF